MRKSYLAYLAVTLLTLLVLVSTFTFARAAVAGPGVGNIPQEPSPTQPTPAVLRPIT